MKPENRSFVVVLRGPAAAHFEPEEYLRITDVPGPAGNLSVSFRTRYVDLGLGTDLPWEIWIDVRGVADGLDTALGFANAALTVMPMLSFGANAPIGIPRVELAFENTPGKTKREFFQQFLPEERNPSISRRIRVEPIRTFIQQVVQHAEFERLYRAITQYNLALLNWDSGKSILAIAHLYMAVEALTPVVRRRLCRERDKDKNQLAETLGVERTQLDSAIRKEYIFQGDDGCYKKAKTASDAFEHGFKSFPDIRALGKPAKEKTATYLRIAILNELSLETAIRKELIRSPYDQPLASWRIDKRLRGHLLGKTDHLAADGHIYPIMRWKTKLKSSTRTQAGEYKVSLDEKFTASLAPGVSFQPCSYEVLGPSGFTREKSEEKGLEEDPLNET